MGEVSLFAAGHEFVIALWANHFQVVASFGFYFHRVNPCINPEITVVKDVRNLSTVWAFCIKRE
tara:strand:- start:758 stop:949 length:192 start_codon:yes stop_codon:yes gene_type:complete